MGKGLEQIVNIVMCILQFGKKKTLGNKKTTQVKMGKGFEHIYRRRHMDDKQVCKARGIVSL